jgi:hypothetical protein
LSQLFFNDQIFVEPIEALGSSMISSECIRQSCY